MPSGILRPQSIWPTEAAKASYHHRASSHPGSQGHRLSASDLCQQRIASFVWSTSHHQASEVRDLDLGTRLPRQHTGNTRRTMSEAEVVQTVSLVRAPPTHMRETDEVSGLSYPPRTLCTPSESSPVRLPSPSSSRPSSARPSRLGRLSPASKDFSITRSLLSKDRSLRRKHGFTSEEGR